MDIDSRLTELKASMKKSSQSQSETVRTILSWFGYRRRGNHVNALIEQKFAEHGLHTDPPVAEPWIDAEVTISLLQEPKVPGGDARPTLRLDRLGAANQPPVSVKKSHKIAEAFALMLEYDYSQLPVMSNERTIEGYISWRTIGERIALGNSPEFVNQCMETDVRILEATTPLTEAIDVIIRHEFIMVKNKERFIRGPVTTMDLAEQYHVLAEPFLLVGRIENSIRRILDVSAPLDVMQAVKFGGDEREIKGSGDLTFSEYKGVLGHADVWSKLGLQLPKSNIMRMLEEVRVARNDVMHFHGDDDKLALLRVLRSAARMFESIAESVVARLGKSQQ